MGPIVAALWLTSPLWAQTYELTGKVTPESQASVSLHGATSPFAARKLTDPSGKFRFTRLLSGAYTVVVFVPGRGESRITVDVGPGTADQRGRVAVTVPTEGRAVTPDQTGKVSARELRIPDRARREYQEADKRLARRDVEGAIARLQKAVEIAPQFCAAWNHLGTIAYQTQRYEDAARYFRRGLEADPESYEPLVNLGGVLLNLNQPREALSFNLHAVLKRPADALAHSQLGMTYFALGQVTQAEAELTEARKLDPGHFSHPQILLAEIALRRGDREAAATWLDEFVKYHPDAADAAAIRSKAAELRAERRWLVDPGWAHARATYRQPTAEAAAEFA